ncbi:hypothetical protein EMIHUDRAFT_460829, partial [Emiliania huxleyi CCMP1516]|uniref:Uncharacterized protein n=2 Tax=Emiliania huxleyi TaxID=2903 RepID=A0A0D3IQS9_EMIH1
RRSSPSPSRGSSRTASRPPRAARRRGRCTEAAPSLLPTARRAAAGRPSAARLCLAFLPRRWTAARGAGCLSCRGTRGSPTPTARWPSGGRAAWAGRARRCSSAAAWPPPPPSSFAASCGADTRRRASRSGARTPRRTAIGGSHGRRRGASSSGAATGRSRRAATRCSATRRRTRYG